MATLINGDGNPAVYAVQDADWYIGLLGGQTRILNRGLKFAYHVEDINTFLMDDGLILTKEGRRIQLDANAQDEITIPNGVQGSTQYYVVGYHLYTDASANQLCEVFIQQMDNATDTIEEKTFISGETEVYISLYRITQTELVVSNVQLLLPIDTTQAEDRASLALSLSDLRSSFMGADTALSNRITANTNNIANIRGIISTVEEGDTATAAYSSGDFVQYTTGGTTYFAKVVSSIAIGDTFVNGTNVENTTIADNVGGIDRTPLTPPTVSGSYTYDGTEKTVVWSGLDTTKVEIQGTQSATNAGTYTCTAVLKDSYNYCWTDGTNAPIEATWTIAKATNPMTLALDTVMLERDGSIDVAISNAQGEVSASSDDTSVATATMGVDKVTVEWKAVGTCIVSVTAAGNDNYNPITKNIEVTCIAGATYGVEWAGTSTSTWTRTDRAALFSDPSPAVSNGDGSSPFDSILPWSGMVREERTGGTMVKIPKYWYKWTRDGVKMKLQIADYAASGFYVSPAHADRGDGVGERDYVYVGAYHCGNNYKSETGVSPIVNITRATARTKIHTLGSTIWQWDYAMYWTIAMLYLVEYADWNSQAVIGYGCGSGVLSSNGGTDSMIYHTGTNAASRTTYGYVRYRWIENLWSNVFDWCDGIYFSGKSVYCIKNPSNFSDTAGGTKVGERPTATGYIRKWTNPSASGFEYALYPDTVIGIDGYVCDYCYYGASGITLLVGGYYGSNNQTQGLFYLTGNYVASTSLSYIGSRIMELPAA